MKKEKMCNKGEFYKTILAILIGVTLVALAWHYVENYNKDREGYTREEAEQIIATDELLEEEDSIGKEEHLVESGMVALVDCLKDNGVTMYGNKSCPACASLAESFGGYNVIDSIYVECTEERERCDKEKETNYVPEVQIEGEVYSGNRSPSQLAAVTDCPF